MTTTATTTLPLTAGNWTLDANHSAVTFKVRHLGLTNVRGRFNSFTAGLTIGESLADTAFDATIDITSIDTNQADRDAHLLGTDFFSADANPTITFVSTAITGDGSDYTADGDLTINGVTKPVTLDVEFNGSEVFPGDQQLHAGFVASAIVKRDDFGIDFNMPLGVDKMALGQKISIEIDAQFVAPAA
ncbi:MAG: YceI family protein [Ilumatobacteraceae bacterium]